MSKRLRLAKNLLKNDGALICAVDHNEQETLGLLLKEIFPGREITCVTIVHNPRGIQGDNFAYTHEFAYFVYPSRKYINRKQRSNGDEEWANLRNWGGESTREHGKSLFYPIYFKNDKVSKIGEMPADTFHPTKAFRKLKSGELEIWPIDNKGVERKWRYSRETLSEILDVVRVIDVRGIPQAQLLKSEDRYKTVWTDTKYDANAYGTQLVKEIIGKEFPYPKSLYTIKECIEAVAQKNDAIILDFFAGSGTTGHAVLEMNKSGGNRQFILCTNNEDNNGSGTKIASDICYPRIKNVMRGYTSKSGKVNGLGGKLKYFSTAFVDSVKTDNDKRVFTSRCGEMLCLAESTFNEVMSKKGAFAIYENADQMTGIIYDEDAISDFKKEAKKHKKPFVVYVFSYDHTYNEEDFEDLENLRTVKPIPEVILNVYRKIYKELYKPRHL
jgi:adenine-specific DNA-methyltransferase